MILAGGILFSGSNVVGHSNTWQIFRDDSSTGEAFGAFMAVEARRRLSLQFYVRAKMQMPLLAHHGIEFHLPWSTPCTRYLNH